MLEYSYKIIIFKKIKQVFVIIKIYEWFTNIIDNCNSVEYLMW